MNPWKALLNSRKFWLLVLDTVVSTATLLIGLYVMQVQAEVVLALIAIIQPVFIYVIKAVLDEDVAKLAAGTHPSQS